MKGVEGDSYLVSCYREVTGEEAPPIAFDDKPSPSMGEAGHRTAIHGFSGDTLASVAEAALDEAKFARQLDPNAATANDSTADHCRHRPHQNWHHSLHGFLARWWS